MPKVVNIRTAVSGTYILVDRNTRWGNPFVLGVDGDRDTVCDLFEKYAEWRLSVQPNWLKPLEDADIGCHCAPKRCHGDTLVKLANRQPTLFDKSVKVELCANSELYDKTPGCDGIVVAKYSGIACSKCSGWFCY